MSMAFIRCLTGVLFCMTWIGAVVCPSTAGAVAGAGEVTKGNEFYRQGQYRQAIESYDKASQRNPSEAAIDYNLGAAYYKDGKYDKAVESFQKSLLTDDEALRNKVYYNLGNALYRKGILHENGNIEQAVSLLQESLNNYEKVMAADTNDADARANHEWVRKELVRLKERQQQAQNPSTKKSDPSHQKKEGQDQAQDSSSKDAKSNDDQSKQDASSSGNKEAAQKESVGKDASDHSRNDVPGQDIERAADKKDEMKEKDAPSASGDKTNKSEEKKPEGVSEGTQHQRNGASGQAAGEKLLSQEEARALLDDFDQNDQPKGMLNFLNEKRDSRPVDKDW